MISESAKAVVRRRWRRRIHPLTRIGWSAASTSKSRNQTIVGISMMGLGWYLKRASKTAPIYTHVAKPGETVRIHVMRGSSSLADTTIRT